MNQYKELKDSFLLLKAQINACTTLILSGSAVYGRPANEGDRCSD